MRGNWLVIGPLPQLGNPAPATLLQPGVAMSLDVFSGEIVGNVALQIPCMDTSGTLLGAIGGATRLQPATPNANGTFVLQDVLLGGSTVHQVVVKGTLPLSAGDTWRGMYTLDNPNTGCVPVTGSFTAVPVSQLTGTFSGTGALSGASTPVTITTALMQGGPGSLNVPNAPVTSENLVFGMVAVQGSACFSSGTTMQETGALYGDFFQVQFSMNDGSLMSISGTLGDTAAGKLMVTNVFIHGGACNNAGGFLGATLIRQ